MTQHAALFQKLRPGRPVVFALNKVDLIDAAAANTETKSLADAFDSMVVATSAANGTAAMAAEKFFDFTLAHGASADVTIAS